MKDKQVFVVMALLCTAAGIYFSRCDAWMKPLVYSDEEFDSTVAVRIDPNPFSPNVFYQNGGKPQSTEEWQEICGFKLIGSKFNKTEWEIPPQSYTIEDFDNTNTGEYSKIVPVKVYYDDSYNGRLWTEFEIMLLPPGPYYPIKAYGKTYGNEDAHGTAIPFPSSAKTGDAVYITVSPDADYELVKDSLRLYPPPPPADDFIIGKDADDRYFFTMPDYTNADEKTISELSITAVFEKVLATRDSEHGVERYSSLAGAVYAGGTQGVVTILSNVTIDETIVLNNGGELTIRPKDGAVITIARGSGTGSLFAIGGTEQTPSTLKFETGANSRIIVDGGNKSANAPLINVMSNGAFDMSSGVTLQNNQNTGDNLGGGAVCNNGTFTMRGGNISGNSALLGGGVYNNGVFTMSGSGVVEQGNDVYLTDSKVITVNALTESGLAAKITPKTTKYGVKVLAGLTIDTVKRFTLNVTEANRVIALDGGEGKISVDGQGYSSFQEAIDAAVGGSADDPAIIALNKDFTIASDGERITLNNGEHIKLVPGNEGSHMIKRTASDFGSLFTVQSGASLTLQGCGDYKVIIDGGFPNYTATDTLIKVYSGTFTMKKGATLQYNYNNNKDNYGGGVYVEDGTFTMAGGSISGTKALRDGGGVYLKGSNALFTMEDGSVIEGNRATFGAGAYIASGNFRMTGGVIKNNTAEITTYAKDPRGGGLLISGAFTMTGGEICNNASEDKAGGIMLQWSSSLSLIKNKEGCYVYGADNPALANTAVNDNYSLRFDLDDTTGDNCRSKVRYNSANGAVIIPSGNAINTTF